MAGGAEPWPGPGGQTAVNTSYRPQFWIDLEEGVAFLAEKASTETATRWHTEVMNTVQLLEQLPYTGRVRHDLRPEGIRSLVVRKFPRYLVFYHVEGENLELLRVKHGMMDLPSLFGGSDASAEI